MPRPSADEIITRKHTRGFIQPGAARPNNSAHYYGLDNQYFIVGDATKPNLGTINPVWVPDPRAINAYRLVGRTIAPPDLAQADITLLEKHGSIPVQLGRIQCTLNVYEMTGKCKDLSSLLNGWDDFVTVFSNGLVENIRLGARTGWDDGQVEDVLSTKWGDIYGVGKLSFGEDFTTQIDRELVDVVYQSNVQCGDCGPADDGTKRIYGVTKSSGSGSPGLPAELVYTVDGGATKAQTTITSFGATEDPLGIDIAGNTLIVISTGGIYWATLNAKTGVPSTFTKVTTGLVSGKTLTDIFVLNAREIFFSALGGYIYKSTDITAGVTAVSAAGATSQDLYRINGDGNETIVAVGAASVVVKSVNRGVSWGTTTTNPSAIPADIKSLAVRDSNYMWVGYALLGRMFYTLNGGETWTEKSFTGSGAGSVRDIVMVSDEVIHVLYDDNTPTAYLLTTFDGGADFARNDSGSDRILNWPTFTRGNRVAFPDVSDLTVAVNNVVVAGLAGNAVDGIWLQGAAARL